MNGFLPRRHRPPSPYYKALALVSCRDTTTSSVVCQQIGGTVHRFGEKLRLLRTRSGMTLQELASALGYTAHGYISELESGKKLPSTSLLLRAARLFDVSTDQLMKDEMEIDAPRTDRSNRSR